MRKRLIALATTALAVATVLTLGGCTSASVTLPSPLPSASSFGSPSGSPSPSASISADAALRPVIPSIFTADAAEKETVRIADAIDSLLPVSMVIHVDNNARLVAATGKSGSYFGVLRHVTLSPKVDPVLVAKAVAKKLVASGWSQLQASDNSGVHLITLSSGSLARTSWFVIVSGDPRTVGQSVLSVQLASPDLP